jgi:phosphoribosyl 1,2-cyclic phosphodiesterase
MINIVCLASSSKGNCHVIDDGFTKVMLDCGLPWQTIQKKTNFTTNEISAICLTHEHADHSKSADAAMKAGIDMVMSEGTRQALNVTSHRVRIVKSKQQFEVGTFIGLALETQHDANEPLAFLLESQKTKERVLYLTDTFYFKFVIPGINYLLIECNYSQDILDNNVEFGEVPPAMKKRLIQSHFSLENVKNFLKANDLSNVQEIVLIHLSDCNSDEARFKREIQELTGKLVRVAQA